MHTESCEPQDVIRIYRHDRKRTNMANNLTSRGARISPRVVVGLLEALEVEVAQLNARQARDFTLHGRKLSPEALLNAVLADYISLPADERHAILANGLRSVERMLDTDSDTPKDRARIETPAVHKSPRSGKDRTAKRA